MKLGVSRWIALGLAMGWPLSQALSQALPQAAAQSGKAGPSVLAPLQTLEGEWTARTTKGERVTETLRSIANGSAMEEVQAIGDGPVTVTMFAANNIRIVMTHYGAAGNQPRMQTNGLVPGQTKYDFSFVDVTNLPNAMAGHMQHLTLQIIDSNHFDETWTWRENGADKVLDVMHFERKK